MTETALATAGDRELRRRGAYWINTHGTVTSDTGTPDRICCYGGYFIAVEWKTPTGRLSVKQRWHLDRVRRAGGIAIEARSLDDLVHILDSVDRWIAAGEKLISRVPTT